jgi:hypothetical protein
MPRLHIVQGGIENGDRDWRRKLPITVTLISQQTHRPPRTLDPAEAEDLNNGAWYGCA